MPADNVQGMRADTLALLKQLDSPVYRWPGGNFVSGYNWRDGIGDRDRRPPRKNPAWKGIEHNDFGLDEFMVFCRHAGHRAVHRRQQRTGRQPQRRRGSRSTPTAPADTPGGQLRAKNGHPEPYGVSWWSIGNEMFGDWQLGHMALEKYIRKAQRVRQGDAGGRSLDQAGRRRRRRARGAKECCGNAPTTWT